MTLLAVDNVVKEYARGWPKRQVTFRLEATFRVEQPGIVGVMGPNGSGKTTLFELITGSNAPTSGTVRCMGQDIHNVKARERDRLAIHYHQSYQVRRFRRRSSSPPPGPISCSSRPTATTPWCTCSTSRSSTRRTATSASCWIFSAA
jgi:ABC-type branched-subunit amino acid transport system ATPase component